MVTVTEKYIPRLKTLYKGVVVQEMMKRFAFKNPMEVPRLVKVVVNIGVNEAKENMQALEAVREELALIAGQLPEIRRAKKSVAAFKLRQGMPIGLRVTLRRGNMYDFLDRLNSLAIPRMRDFRGLNPNGFDGHGNYNLGLTEQFIFPEIQLDKPIKAHGMNVTIVTDAGEDGKARALLELLGFPFKKAAKGAYGK